MLSIYDLPSVIFLFKCPENIWPGQVVSFYHFSLLSISFSTCVSRECVVSNRSPGHEIGCQRPVEARPRPLGCSNEYVNGNLQ